MPLHAVVFNQPTAIPGSEVPFTNVVAGEARQMGGAHFTCPQPFFDPYTRSIWIEGREYPLERVHYWERAKMAKKVVATRPDPNYTIGKRPV